MLIILRQLEMIPWGQNLAITSGKGTNLKVGGGTPPEQSGGKKIFFVPLNFFGSISTISWFGEHFRDSQYSLVCCFATQGAPPSVSSPLVRVGDMSPVP